MYNPIWPFKKKVAFAIRDDDVSYFTQPWMIDRLYEKAWQLGFKVSLAVIPNIKSPRSNARFQAQGKKFFSISKNRDLVNYLREKIRNNQVDIVQHGYTHKNINGKPEFANNDFELINDMLKRGNKILRETFKLDVRVFTAPHDRISRAAWKSIVRNNMYLCRKFTLGRFLTTAPIYSLNLCKLVKNLIRQPNPFELLPNSLIDLSDTLVVQWDPLFSSDMNPEVQFKIAEQQFFERLDEGSAFVTLHHHWDYFFNSESKLMKQGLLTGFNRFLTMVSSMNGVWKTTLSGLCTWITKNSLIDRDCKP